MRVARRHRSGATYQATGDGGSASPEDVRALHSIELEVLGERIRRARLDRKISQRDLTQNLFTSAYLSSLELGKTRPTYITLVELGHRLDKSLDYFLRPAGGLLDRSLLADNDYLKVLQARQTLLLAQFAVAREELLASASSDLVNQAQSTLQSVNTQLVRLSDFDRANYYYLLGQHQSLQSETISFESEEPPVLTQLEQARQQLEAARPSPRSGEVNQQLQTQWLQLAALIYLRLGDFYLTKEDRVMQALAHYQTGLNLLEHPQSETALTDGGNTTTADTFSPIHRLHWHLLASIARYYLRLSEREQALNFNQQAVELAMSEASNSFNFLPNQPQLERLSNYYWEQARLYGEQGDFQQASLEVGRGLQLCEQFEDGTRLLITLGELAALEVQAEQYEAANNTLSQLLSFIGGQGAYSPIRLRAQITQVQLRFKQGQLDEAARIIQEVIQQATASNQLSEFGWLLYQTAAEVQAGLGNKETAKSYYQQALQVLSDAKTKDTPTPLQEAELYYSYGQQLREWGEIEEAFGLLEKAYKLRQS